MKIVIIGGTGLIGSRLVARLRAQGHQVVPAAPSTGVNALTGEGLDEALTGAQVVVDVSNAPSFSDDEVMDFFRTATTNLLTAAARAGAGHVVALTVVGTDRLPESGYFRAKVLQEKLITASGLPYSLVHATQFFEFAVGIADSATVDGAVRLTDAGVQPIAADDVAEALARVAAGAPLNGRVEIAGPEAFGLDRWVGTVLEARADPRPVVTDARAPYFGAVLGLDSLMPGPEASIAPTSLGQWLPGS